MYYLNHKLKHFRFTLYASDILCFSTCIFWKRLLCFSLEDIFNPKYYAPPHTKYAFLFCFCLRPTEAYLLISPYNGNEEVTWWRMGLGDRACLLLHSVSVLWIPDSGWSLVLRMAGCLWWRERKNSLGRIPCKWSRLACK